MNQIVVKATEQSQVRWFIRTTATDLIDMMHVDPPVRATTFTHFIGVRATALIAMKNEVFLHSR